MCKHVFPFSIFHLALASVHITVYALRFPRIAIKKIVLMDYMQCGHWIRKILFSFPAIKYSEHSN